MYKIFIAALFVVAKNWKSRGCPSIGEWLNKLWYMNVMEYYCAVRNDEQEDFREAWKDLYELMLSERSRTRRTLCTGSTTGFFQVDSELHSNARTQKIPNGLLRQNSFHIQRKNYGIQSQNVVDHFLMYCVWVCYMVSPIHFNSSV